MRYKDYLAGLPDEFCPFCVPQNRSFIENDSALLTYALAPYHPHHLLVVPKRHVLSSLEISNEETVELWQLIRCGMQVLRELGYKDYSVLVREGEVGGIKSIAHLHYHIIPNDRIGDLDVNGEGRRILKEEEIAALRKEIDSVIGVCPL